MQQCKYLQTKSIWYEDAEVEKAKSKEMYLFKSTMIYDMQYHC